MRPKRRNWTPRKTTPAEAAWLFEKAYREGPWPNAAQSYDLAVWIEIVSFRATYLDFQNEDRDFRKRRAVIAGVKRLIEEQKKAKANAPIFPGHASKALEDLVALEIAFDRAEAALLWPYDPRDGERAAGWWHKAARIIAGEMRGTLIKAHLWKGIHEFKFKNLDGRSPFVRGVAAALKLAFDKDFNLATVAAFLRKLPDDPTSNFEPSIPRIFRASPPTNLA